MGEAEFLPPLSDSVTDARFRGFTSKEIIYGEAKRLCYLTELINSRPLCNPALVLLKRYSRNFCYFRKPFLTDAAPLSFNAYLLTDCMLNVGHGCGIEFLNFLKIIRLKVNHQLFFRRYPRHGRLLPQS